MANIKFVLNRDGVSELMKSPQMMDICRGYANRALASLGSGYETSTHIGRNRLNVEIEARSYAAKVENSKNNSILKALRG